jgi:hypothetical protein
VGFVVNKAALGQVFSEYIGSPAKLSTNFSIIITTPGWHNRPNSGRNWTPPPTIPIKKSWKILGQLSECQLFVNGSDYVHYVCYIYEVLNYLQQQRTDPEI